MQMIHFCNANNAIFLIVPIFCENGQFDILHNIAREHSIPFIDTRIINDIEAFQLPHDGHLTGEGGLALAKIVAKYISESKTE